MCIRDRCQGNNDPHSTIASCVKHFAGYGAPLAGKEYNTVELGERSLSCLLYTSRCV